MKRAVVVAIVACVLAIAAVSYLLMRNNNTSLQEPFINTATLATLPKKDASMIDTSHLASGLIPPTNKWFSGLTLQAVPKTVFPTPLAFTPQESSFSFSLPKVTATKNTLFGMPADIVTASIAGATHYKVTRYDEMSVDLTYANATDKLATITLTAGSPYVFVRALSDTSIAVKPSGGTAIRVENRLEINASSGKYIVAGFDGAQAQNDSQRLPKGSLATLYGIPPGAHGDPLLASAGNQVTSTTVAYEKAGTDYKTAITFATANSRPTLYGFLPHQQFAEKEFFSYATLYGAQHIYSGTNFSFTTPSIPVVDSLKLDAISQSDKELLVTTLRREINATQIKAEDTYFGGKEMYRSAQLLQLARGLNEEAIADTIQQILHKELASWLSLGPPRTKKFFYYDTKIQSIVGETVAFGSQELNDHHFHYGYFIYAAAILSKYESSFVAQHGPMVDLLVADIANYRAKEQLPLRRAFDPYFGHSWASGSAPFNDGNNQESSSEAINAWVATSLWAAQTKNAELEAQSGWMLSNEAAATNSYWMNFDAQQAPYNQRFGHSLVSLNWGGKRDYATFFSAEPAAMLGILLIPMNPTMIYQSQYGDRIATHVREAIPQGAYSVQFGDYILMYEALTGKNGLLSKAQALDDATIDGANSRSFMYAWIMSQKN